MHSRFWVDLRPSIARPKRSVNISPPLDPERGGHHSASAPVGGYPHTQGVHSRPLIPPLRKNVSPWGNPPPLPPQGNAIPQRVPAVQATAPTQAGVSTAQEGSLPQLVSFSYM